MPSKPKAAVAFIFITLLIDVIGFGIIIPVVPNLIKEFLDPALADKAPIYGGLLVAAYAVTQFFCAPIVGGLSDQYGRRPVLLASLFGFGLDYIFVIFAPSIVWLFVGRIVAGIMGASFTTAGAYIADISPPEKRAQNFGLMGAAFGLGFIIGPVIGGLLGNMGSRVPFIAAASLTLLNWLYGYFILPESLKPENRRKFEWKRANPIGTLVTLWKYPIIRGLLLALTFVYFAAHAVQSNWSWYTIEKFKWKPKEIGISLGVVGFVFAIVQGILIRKIIPALGQVKSVYVGLALYAIGLTMYAFATQGWMMYAFTFVYCLGGICGPALQGIMSGVVPPNAQGELQGGFTSLMSLMSIFAPVIMNSVLFPYFTNAEATIYFPGVDMLLGAVLVLVSIVIAYKTLKDNHINPQPLAQPVEVKA